MFDVQSLTTRYAMSSGVDSSDKSDNTEIIDSGLTDYRLMNNAEFKHC